jgi:hypothetical protein
MRAQLPHYDVGAASPAHLLLLGERLQELTDELAQVAQIAVCIDALEGDE